MWGVALLLLLTLGIGGTLFAVRQAENATEQSKLRSKAETDRRKAIAAEADAKKEADNALRSLEFAETHAYDSDMLLVPGANRMGRFRLTTTSHGEPLVGRCSFVESSGMGGLHCDTTIRHAESRKSKSISIHRDLTATYLAPLTQPQAVRPSGDETGNHRVDWHLSKQGETGSPKGHGNCSGITQYRRGSPTGRSSTSSRAVVPGNSPRQSTTSRRTESSGARLASVRQS